MELSTRSAAETAALGEAVAELVVAGDVIVLSGDLGAGKTVFTKGLGSALGVDTAITSPTFTLVHQHEGRLRLYHLDVYRFETAAEAQGLGLAEMMDDDAVTVIEWGERIRGDLPGDHLEVKLELGDGDDERLISLVPVGPRWSARLRVLEGRLAAERDGEA